MLVCLSGIDGSGKGYVAAKLARRLERSGLQVAVLNVDGWLNLPSVRFSPEDPAGNFYRNGLRLDEMFERLVLPLKHRRSIRLTADFAEETATTFRPHTYEYRDLDVIVLEGIFLLKRQYLPHFDFSLWVDCTFETALERALARGQEGLPPDETVRAYQTIYFPAQRLHFVQDGPRGAADLIVQNDHRLDHWLVTP